MRSCFAGFIGAALLTGLFVVTGCDQRRPVTRSEEPGVATRKTERPTLVVRTPEAEAGQQKAAPSEAPAAETPVAETGAEKTTTEKAGLEEAAVEKAGAETAVAQKPTSAMSAAVVAFSPSGRARCEVRRLEKGADLYLNRKFECGDIPTQLQGLVFTALDVKKAVDFKVTIREDGLVWLLIPMQFDQAAYTDNGWESTELSIPVTFSMKKATVLKRRGVKGETYDIPGHAWINPMIAAGAIKVE